jgi:hypothetical protein
LPAEFFFSFFLFQAKKKKKALAVEQAGLMYFATDLS